MAHPTLAAVPDERLRPALDAAFAVAAEGRKQRPPVAPPESLRTYLRFQKLPRSALSVVRAALDADDAFRARVAAAVDPASIGVGLHAWLARPDGWETTVLEAFAGEELADDATSDPAPHSGARRDAARAAAARRAAAELTELRDAIERERLARRDAEAAAGELRDRIARLREEIDGLQRRARRAEQAAAAREAEVQAARDELAAARDAADAAAEVRDQALGERARVEDALEAAGLVLTGDAVVELSDSASPRERGDRSPSGRGDGPHGSCAAGAGDPPVTADAADAVRQAAVSLRRAAEALESAAGTIVGPPRAAASPLPPRHRRAHARPLRRRPLDMPGGVSASSVDGALHLLRAPGLELVVDGYNVAKRAWPALGLADQRERCIDAVEDLVRRFGTRSLIVFDGADVAVAVSTRRLARVRFSPPDVIADDVIREVVAGLPTEQPVAVVTNDREVVSSVRALGANTIASEILLAAAGRAPS